MRILDKAFLTSDEEYEPEEKIVRQVMACLKKIKMDTYSRQYVVHLTVHDVYEMAEDQDGDNSDDNLP
jgi:hypothetical protein